MKPLLDPSVAILALLATAYVAVGWAVFLVADIGKRARGEPWSLPTWQHALGCIVLWPLILVLVLVIAAKGGPDQH